MTSRYEKQKIKEGYDYVIGCDEVGKGSLAGPVVAAAVVLDIARIKDKRLKIREIKDSKLLLPEKREELSINIKANSLGWGIGVVEPEIIDEINIHHATLLAMKKAVEDLLAFLSSVIPGAASPPEVGVGYSESMSGSRIVVRDDAAKCWLVIDGKFCIPKLNMEQEAVVEGDGKILSVAAASIIAKVYRDDLMRKLHERYPCYNFAQHKGYGTLHHRQMILQNGLSPIHRHSFCGSLIV